MKTLRFVLIGLYIIHVYAADNALGLQPYSVCMQAADKIVASLPQQIKDQQNIAPEMLAHQFEMIISKRVENYRLIEDIVNADSPLRSESALILLLQINQAVIVESEQILQEKPGSTNGFLGGRFAAFLSKLIVR